MNPKNPFRNENVEGYITELGRAATRMERLMRELPTTDPSVLGELHSLSMDIERMVVEEPGRERRSMFVDQVRRKAMYQRQRYMKMAHAGSLRNP